MGKDRTELKFGEVHPSAIGALDYIRSIPTSDILRIREALASCSLSGNRMAEVCGGTLDRLLNGEPVSDRYVLGLAWTIQYDSNLKETTEGGQNEEVG